MSGIVVFDPVLFKEVYPQFANVSDAVCGYAFRQAEILCNNTAHSVVKDISEREILLFLLTCHILTLRERGIPVGAVQSATEGSVNATFSVPTIPNAEYFSQTQCGMQYWQSTLQYRVGGLYVAPRCRR